MFMLLFGSNLLLIGLGLLLIALGCIAWRQPRAGNRVAYWHQTIVGLDETSDRFYAQVYQALKDSLQIRQIALTGFGFGPTRLFEGRHIFTERPLYLEARYRHLRYYLYVGQTPAGFFISTWLHSKYVVGDDKPIVLPAGFRYFSRQSLFQYDATLMFNESVHSIVLEVLDRYIQEQQLTPLTQAQRCPVMHAFYGRGLPATVSLSSTASLLASPFLIGAPEGNSILGGNGAHRSAATGETTSVGPAADSDIVGAGAGGTTTGDGIRDGTGDHAATDGATVSGGAGGRRLPLSR